MRRIPLLASSLALLLTSTLAVASVTEPNGTAVPQASADPVQLNTLFTSLGEPVDWKADAASTPNAFSPLCGFTAKFLAHGADCPLDFAWYNETGQPPLASDLHVVIPANSPVGTMFTGTDIKNDPKYLGGLVGFAIVGNSSQFCTQTHYSNPKWNQACTSCNPQAPWVTTLIYPSKTASAFYLAFEDGPTSPFAFNNDGDFNDDVYLVSGVTCVGGGEPCMTNLPGICASGITQCTAAGTVCQQLSQPAAEKCDGLDDDCNGQTDEGDICPAGYLCDKGSCVESCQGGEFKCPIDKVCSVDGHCVDPGCQSVTCDAGKVCVGGLCKGPCDGIVCPYDQVCRVGACVDPCAGLSCDPAQVCDAGVCVAKCDCQPCAASKQCDATSGLCIDPTCVGVTCGAGSHCAAGACVNDCANVVCPADQACKGGDCLPIPPNPTSTSGGSDSTGSFSVGGGSPTATTTGSTGGAGGSAGGAGGEGGSGTGSKSSCGCRVAGDPDTDALGWMGIAIAAFAASRRREKRRA
jgi:MYXO-CTERM domain-containing protein